MTTMEELSVHTVHLLAGGHVVRVWGPPGTGKTRYLTERLRRTVLERGADSALAVSFTVTAAKNLAAQDTGLPDTAMGTLHSLAFRALDRPDVALDPKVVAGWNSNPRVPREWWIYPDARRGRADMIGETGVSNSSGDGLLSQYDMARAQLLPISDCPAPVRRFAATWEEWKTSIEAIDYSDMIFMALQRALSGERAPGNPQVLVVDEAQDLTPLECALCYAWGAHCDRLVFALDDDQAINEWRGGSPEPILNLGTGMDGGEQPDVVIEDIPLQQSYRVPAAVQVAALSWVRQIGERRREKEYRPRCDDEGNVYQGQMYPVRYTLEDEATAQAVAADVDAGRSVMVLASCGYMLTPMIEHLTRMGIPFGNAYRPAEQAWNPLRAQRGTAVAERLFRYLVCDDEALGGWDDDGGRAHLWTGDDVRAWMEMVDVKVAGLSRGVKAAVLPNLPPGELDVATMTGLFADEATIDRAAAPELEWLLGAVLKNYRSKLTYPAAVARRCGPAALVDEPPVTIGTVHSVKGGGADCVYLSPSVSGAGYAQWSNGGEGRNAIIRQFYVGMTRAKERCVILGSRERCVPVRLLCPPELVRR